MSALTSALNTAFTAPGAAFCVQVTGRGSISLQRRATSGDPWAEVGQIPGGRSVDVVNTIITQEWRMVANGEIPTVLAYD